jgi:hypothetical protein
VAGSRRIASYAGALILVWLGGLVVADFALEDRTRQRVADRLTESLQAAATVAGGDLALVRGSIDFDDLAVRRDDLIGRLTITIGSLHCQLPPLGLALFDRDCRQLELRKTRLEVSTAALFKLKRPRRPPLAVGGVVLDDARLELSPSALVPSLGRVVIAIEHAEAGATVFKTPLSWLFGLRQLRATVELPGGVTLQLSYEAGELRASGGVFGPTPIVVPVTLPVRDPADDPAAEMAVLVDFGKGLAEQLFVHRAEDWLKAKLAPP